MDEARFDKHINPNCDTFIAKFSETEDLYLCTAIHANNTWRLVSESNSRFCIEDEVTLTPELKVKIAYLKLTGVYFNDKS